MKLGAGDSQVHLSPRVLIVDRSSESRDVLRTILELRGASTLETDEPELACRLAEKFRPDLIVLDADSDLTGRQEATHDLREAAGRTDTPIVILGTLTRCDSLPPGQFLAKPYHYGALIRRIDDLLAAA